MKKELQIVGTFVALIAAGFAGYSFYKQYNNKHLIRKRRENLLGEGIDDLPIEPDYDFKEIGISALKGAAVGFTASTVLVILPAWINAQGQEEEYVDLDKYLRKVLKQRKFDRQNSLPLEKGQELVEILYHHYRDYLYEKPRFQGSIHKRTAIDESDIDIELVFKKEAFESLEDMYEDVYSFFQEEYNDDFYMDNREQTKSIGVNFKANGSIFRVDIVPKRKINNTKESAALLYTHTYNWLGQKKASWTKTDNRLQSDFGRNSRCKKEIAKLLKILKIKYHYPMRSFAIEQITIRALDSFHSVEQNTMSISENLFIVIDYIANNIANINLKDPANTNNLLITTEDKIKTQKYMFALIEKLEKSPNSIKEYLPLLSI